MRCGYRCHEASIQRQGRRATRRYGGHSTGFVGHDGAAQVALLPRRHVPDFEDAALVQKELGWPRCLGQNFLCGQHATKSVIRLKDGTCTDAKQPMSMMWCGGFGSADWFHNYVENLTFDVGNNNPAAIALQFYSNNSGAVRNCRFVAADGSGLIGLDLGHRDMNGPLLVRNCEVIGFDRGISSARAVNSQTFEYLTLRNQRQVGFDNQGQAISVRGLMSDNSVPAIRTYGRSASSMRTCRAGPRRVNGLRLSITTVAGSFCATFSPLPTAEPSLTGHSRLVCTDEDHRRRQAR